MPISNEVLNGISLAGTALALMMFCSQIPTYIVVVRNRTVGNLSVLPTIGTWANTSAWVVYALLIKDNAILIVNAIGAGIALIYLGVFLLYSPSISRTALHLAGVLAASAVVYSSIALPTSTPIADKVLAMGSVAVACNVVMYAAPLAQLHIALSTFDPAAIPTLLVLVGTMTSLLWGGYGLLLSPPNWFVAGPNVAGIALGIIQLIVAAYIMLSVRRNPSPLGSSTREAYKTGSTKTMLQMSTEKSTSSPAATAATSKQSQRITAGSWAVLSALQMRDARSII